MNEKESSMQPNYFLTQILYHVRSKTLANILFYSVGILFLSFMAQLSIPLQPVPITFESSTVILMGFLLGARQAVIVVSAYLLLGFLGAPIFAGLTGGLGLLMTPKAGYFIGFIPAAAIAGACKDWNVLHSFWHRLSISFFATVIIFFMGVVWFSALTNYTMAWHFGVVPFIFTESMKMIGVSAVSGCFKKYIIF